MRKLALFGLVLGLAAGALADAGWEFSQVTAIQRWPWDCKVDIDFFARHVDGEGSHLRAAKISAKVTSGGVTHAIPSTELSRPWIRGEGHFHVVWTPATTGYPDELKNAAVEIVVEKDVKDVGYLTVDLATGDYGYKPMVFSNEVNSATYKTTAMAFRYIPSTYSAAWRNMMGKTSYRVGSDGARSDLGISDTDRKKEVPANITLTKGFFMGVFPMTRQQYRLLGGTADGNDQYPVRGVSYQGLRGKDGAQGFCYPTNTAVEANTPIGRLRSRTGLKFDFPSEYQWEYAARAGSEGEYFFPDAGLNASQISSKLGEYGAYSNTAAVGSKKPNAWGLYDLIGCCHQWTTTCAVLTEDDTTVGVKHADSVNPKGAIPGTAIPYRTCKGSHHNPGGVRDRVGRLAYRFYQRADAPTGEKDNTGCRLALTLDVE